MDMGELERVIDDVVRPQAIEVDEAGAFPRAQVKALGEAGILGMASSIDMGGGGQGLRNVAAVVDPWPGGAGRRRWSPSCTSQAWR